MDYFKNKTVYITGGSSGIGLEVAKLLAARDAKVVIIARDMKKMQGAKADIDACLPAGGRPAECLSLDVVRLGGHDEESPLRGKGIRDSRCADNERRDRDRRVFRGDHGEKLRRHHEDQRLRGVELRRRHFFPT